MPLREVDEEGRTPEQRAAQEARKGERVAARQAKDAKALALAKKRLETLKERKALLDQGGKLIREAAQRGADGDQAAALAVLRELGKKKHKATLRPSFRISEVFLALRRLGVRPEELPDLGERMAYEWETDLHADEALLRLDLAEASSRPGGVDYKRHLWGGW